MIRTATWFADPVCQITWWSGELWRQFHFCLWYQL